MGIQNRKIVGRETRCVSDVIILPEVDFEKYLKEVASERSFRIRLQDQSVVPSSASSGLSNSIFPIEDIKPRFSQSSVMGAIGGLSVDNRRDGDIKIKMRASKVVVPEN